MLAKRIENLKPYAPGEQPTDREYVKLNANENPYPPSPKVLEAIKSAAENHPEKIGVYPDPDVNSTREKIAEMLNSTGGVFANTEISSDGKCSPGKMNATKFRVTPDMIFCGNGSDEVLSLVFYACFDSDRPLILPEHTYSFYPVYCGFYGIPMKKIPLNSDWTLDKKAMLREANKNSSAIIFANPNAPTGIALSRSEVAAMLDEAPKDKCLIVDEAYADFGEESCIPLLEKYDNLIIVRTFSKSLSFAGMRLGYVVANPKIIDAIFTVKNSFNHFPVDFIAKTAAEAACMDTAHYVRNARKIVEDRESLAQFLSEKGWLVIPSKTNFIFASKRGKTGDEIYQAAKKEGILIRLFKTPGIENFVRITIGTKEQTDALKKVLGAL